MKRKFVYGLLSVLIAFGLWLYVVTVVNPEWEETFYNIPVALENEQILHDRGLMLVSEEDPEVTLRLSGNRADMIKLNSSNITIRADLARIYSAGEQSINYSIVYPGDVPSNAFEIVSQTPQQITLQVVERKSKAVDVVLKLIGAEPGYMALEEDVLLDYEKITISGPADVIDRIAVAEVTVDLTGQKATINQEFDYAFKDAEGNEITNKWVKATPQKINCTIKIQKVLDMTVAVDVLEGAGLTAKDYEIIYYNQETGEIINTPIVISGSETQLAVAQSAGVFKDNKLVIAPAIDLALIAGTQTDNGLEIVVSDLNIGELLTPYELINHSGINVVKVVVKIPNTDAKIFQIKTFPITNIEQVNVPAGLKVNITTKTLNVTMRGPEYQVKWIKEADITVQVDFSNAVVGEGKYTATVIFTRYNQSFVVGSYVVNATVTPA